MGPVDPSDQLVAFVRQHIGSIELLEVLLLLHRRPEEAWDADTVAAELRIQPRSVAGRLAVLNGMGLAKPQASGTDPPPPSQNGAVNGYPTTELFRFEPESALAPLVDELAAVYQTHRVRIIEIIFSQPADNIRVFADAFVIGRGGKKDG